MSEIRDNVFPKGKDGLPIYPTRAEAIGQIDTLRASLDEARENLRMAVHVLRCTASTAANQSQSGWTAPVYRDLLSDINNQVRALLSRIDGGV